MSKLLDSVRHLYDKDIEEEYNLLSEAEKLEIYNKKPPRDNFIDYGAEPKMGINYIFNAWYFREAFKVCRGYKPCWPDCLKAEGQRDRHCTNSDYAPVVLDRFGKHIYSEKLFALFYWKLYIPKYINQVSYYLQEADIRQRLEGSEEVRILSLGCGPANDLFALEHLQSTPGSALYGKNIKYVGVDSGKVWQKEHRILEENQSPNMAIKFIDKDIQECVKVQGNDRAQVKAFLKGGEKPQWWLEDFKPNVILMNYVLSDMQKFEAMAFFKEKKEAEEKEAKKIVPKGMADSLFDGYKSCTDSKEVIFGKMEELSSFNDKMLLACYGLDHKVHSFMDDLLDFTSLFGSLLIISDYYDSYSAQKLQEDRFKLNGFENFDGNIPYYYLSKLIDKNSLGHREIPKCSERLSNRLIEIEKLVGKLEDHWGDSFDSFMTDNKERLLFNFAYCYYPKAKK